MDKSDMKRLLEPIDSEGLKEGSIDELIAQVARIKGFDRPEDLLDSLATVHGFEGGTKEFNRRIAESNKKGSYDEFRASLDLQNMLPFNERLGRRLDELGVSTLDFARSLGIRQGTADSYLRGMTFPGRYIRINIRKKYHV